MNQLQIFNYAENEIRTITKDGEPWFVLKDVCEVLEIGNTTDTANRLDEDERATFDSIECLRKDTVFINESGLYNVILRSNKPQAKAFRKWVTSEVLPSIRKHGMYATPTKLADLLANPDMLIEMLQELKKEQAKQAALKAKNEALTLQLDESKDYYTVKRVAALNNISWKDISWKALKHTSQAMELDIMKIFDANYGTVNAYHIDVWKHEYPHFKY